MSEPIEDDESIASARQDRATARNISVQRQPVVGRASRSVESTPIDLVEVGQSGMAEERAEPPQFAGGAEFDCARPEDRDVTTEDKLTRMRDL